MLQHVSSAEDTTSPEIVSALLAALEIHTPRITQRGRQLERMPLYYNVVESDLTRYLVQGGLGIRYAAYASGAKKLNAAEENTLRDVSLAHARLMGLYMEEPVVAGWALNALTPTNAPSIALQSRKCAPNACYSLCATLAPRRCHSISKAAVMNQSFGSNLASRSTHRSSIQMAYKSFIHATTAQSNGSRRLN